MKVNAIALIAGTLYAATSHLPAQIIDPDGTGVSHGDPFTPVGSLSVYPEVVYPGVYPEMTWAIEYPQSIPDLVVIDSKGGMTTINDKSDRLTIRVAGVSYGSGGTDLEIALWVRLNGGTWNLIHYGTEDEVTGDVVFQQNIQPGTKVDLAARGRTSGGSWGNTYWTISDSPNVAALIDGNTLPSESSAFATGQFEDFMTQFVDESNKVEAGPRDVIHVFEVGSSTPGDSFFDMQDIVVVSTFGREKNNNGHGNNEDGVDMSNPGNAPFEDSDPYLDDEKTKIKKK